MNEIENPQPWECGVCGDTVGADKVCHRACCKNKPGICHSDLGEEDWL